MKKLLTALVTIGLLATLTAAAPAYGRSPTDCWAGTVPAGALPGQPPPVFCSLADAADRTRRNRPNGWVDDFDHGLSFATFDGAGYRVYDNIGATHQSVHWRHADHWMVDLAPDPAADPSGQSVGGALMRPRSAFRFTEDETFSVEAGFAAGIESYNSGAIGTAWGEIVVTTRGRPDETGRHNALYGYDYFPGHYTLGCRFQPDSNVVCSLMDNTRRGLLEGGRVWEMSFFQPVGTTLFGGSDFVGDGDVFAECGPGDPDSVCRSQWRLELTRTSLRVLIDDQLYFEQTGIPPLPDEFVDGRLFVYAGSMAGRHESDVIRFHWDRLAVNQ